MSDFLTARRQMAELIRAIPSLPQVAVFIERDRGETGETIDINDDVENALNKRGLACVVMSTSGARGSQLAQGGAQMTATVVVALLENEPRNMGNADADQGLPAGHKIPGEVAVWALIRGLIGRECGHGVVKLNAEGFMRPDPDQSGVLDYYIAFDVPLTARPG